MSARPIDVAASSAILLDFGEPRPQRRLTVLFRLILAIPQILFVGFIGIGAFFAAIYSWFGALIRGKPPTAAANFIVGYLRRAARLYAYLNLLTDAYPPLDSTASHPVDLVASPGDLNRAAVFFRIVLALPAWILGSLMTTGMLMFSLIAWITTLIAGRLPMPMFQANSVVIRYYVRVLGYSMLVTSEWPWGAFGDSTTLEEPPLPALQPLGSSTWSEPTSSSTRAGAPSTPAEAQASAPSPVEAWTPVTQVAEAASAPPTRSWTIPASSGAKVLVVLYLALGAVYQVALRPTHFFFNSPTSTINAAQSAITALDASLTATNTAALQCPADSRRLRCLTTVLREQASAYARLDQALHAISFPFTVETQASAMEGDIAADTTIYAHLSSLTSITAVAQYAQSEQRQLVQLQNDFNAQYTSMRKLLVGA